MRTWLSVWWIDCALAVTAIIGLALAALANPDPVLRDGICHTVGFCPRSENPVFWNSFFFDAGLGAMLNVMFFWLLVRLPNWERRRRLKRGLRAYYTEFKRDVIATFLDIANQGHSSYDVDALLDQKAFRRYFSRDTVTKQSKMDDVLNGLREHHLQDIMIATEIFREELSFVMASTDIRLEDATQFLKRLSHELFRLKANSKADDYDSEKRLGGFFYEILSGWDFLTGEHKEDIIDRVIRSI